LVGLDLKTGKEAWAPLDLGDWPFWTPSISDLDGDGQPDALFLHNADPRVQSDPPKLALTAVSLKTQGTIWQTKFIPSYRSDNPYSQIEIPYVIADLKGDRHPAIVIPVGDNLSKTSWSVGPGNPVRWSGLEALDGGTGKSLWQRRLWMGQGRPVRIDRFLVGPD